MRGRVFQMLRDIERVKHNPLAAGIGRSSGLFDALDNISGLVVELVDRVEELQRAVGGDNYGQG